MVLARLRCKSGGKVFCVANYHMPCMFFLPDVMVIHTALALQLAQRFAQDDKLVVAGDWNFKPGSTPYNVATQGPDAAEEVAHLKVSGHDWDAFAGVGMRSAYLAANGEEPDFTNYAQTMRDKVPFVDTLDYVFVSEGVKVVSAPRLPHRDDVDGPMPLPREPSDHLLLAVTVRV